MGVNSTQYRNLKYADSGTPMHETEEDNALLLEQGLLIYVEAFGEAVSKYDPICILQADDEAYICDGNNKLKTVCLGLAFAGYAEDSDGYIFGPGCIVPVTGEDWTRNVNVYVADDQTLSQTAGTYTVPVGVPLDNTRLVVTGGNIWYQDTHITDPSVTATTPGTGADATTWTGAQCTAAFNDITSLTAKVVAINALLEKSGLMDDGS